MIRWERQQDGNWLGLSGELLVATVAKDASEKEQWLWTITALKRPKGWRKGAGHRSSWIDARRAAEEYWERWLEEAALRPDVMRLASRSVVTERERKSRRRGQVDNCLNFCTTTRAACLSTGTWQGNQNVWQGLARN